MGLNVLFGGCLVRGGKDVTEVFANALKASCSKFFEIGTFGIARSREEINRGVESREYDVLICQDSIGSDNIGGGTLRGWQGTKDGLKIVLVLPPNKKGAKKLENLYMGGYYDGLFSNELTAENIQLLITKGRTKEEAFVYYGLNMESIALLEREAREKEERKIAQSAAAVEKESSYEAVSSDKDGGVSSIIIEEKSDDKREKIGEDLPEELNVGESSDTPVSEKDPLKQEDTKPLADGSAEGESVQPFVSEPAKEEAKEEAPFDLFGRPDEVEPVKEEVGFEFKDSDMDEFAELMGEEVSHPVVEAVETCDTEIEELLEGEQEPAKGWDTKETKDSFSEDGGFDIFSDSDTDGPVAEAVQPTVTEVKEEEEKAKEPEAEQTVELFGSGTSSLKKESAEVANGEGSVESSYEIVSTVKTRSSSASQTGYVVEVQDEHLLSVLFDPIPEGLGDCIDNVSCTVMVQTGEKGKVVNGKYKAGTIVFVAYPLAEIEDGCLLMEAPNKDLLAVEGLILNRKCSVLVKAL